MKPLIILAMFSSIAMPKDPRVEIAKTAAAELTQQYLQIPGSPHKVILLKTNVVEQVNDFFLVSVVVNMNYGIAKYIPGPDKPYVVRVSNHRMTSNFCLILQISTITGKDGKPITEISYIENNNDVLNVYIHECDAKFTKGELDDFKHLNLWPNE